MARRAPRMAYLILSLSSIDRDRLKGFTRDKWKSLTATLSSERGAQAPSAAGGAREMSPLGTRASPASLAELWSSFPTVQALLGPPLCAGAEDVYIDMGTNMGRHITMLYHPQRFGFIGEYRNWFGSCGWADRGDKAKVCGNATVVRQRLANVCVMSFEPSPMHVPNLEGRFRDYRSEGTVFPAAGAQRLHFFSAAIAAHNSVETFHWTFGRGHDTGASLARSSALQHRQRGPLAVPQLGSCCSSGRAWRLREARHAQKQTDPLGDRPTGRPATAFGARASRLRSRRFRCLDHSGPHLLEHSAQRQRGANGQPVMAAEEARAAQRARLRQDGH